MDIKRLRELSGITPINSVQLKEATDEQRKFDDKIILTHVRPPIPSRAMDWHAHLDSYDGAPDAGHQATGNGATPEEALHDLMDMVLDHHPEWTEESIRAAFAKKLKSV